MELPVYKKPVTGIIVQQLKDCGWVTLIEMPFENKSHDSKEVQDAIEVIEKLFYEGEKVQLSVAGLHVCIRGIEKGGTFRVGATYTIIDEPATI
jgi:hypothetical protein